MVMAAAAASFGVEPVITLSRLVYKRGDLWYPSAVQQTYLIGTVFMVFVAFCLLAIYRLSVKASRLFRLTLLWAIVISTAMVVQRLLGVVMTDLFEFSELARLGLDLGVYATYVRLTVVERWALSAIGVFLGLLLGMFLAKPLLKTALSSSHLIHGRNTGAFLILQVLIPSALGLTLAAVATYPASLFNHLLCMVALAIIIVGMALGQRIVGKFRLTRQRGSDSWSAIPMLLFILIVVAVRLTLVSGIAL